MLAQEENPIASTAFEHSQVTSHGVGIDERDRRHEEAFEQYPLADFTSKDPECCAIQRYSEVADTNMLGLSWWALRIATFDNRRWC